MDARFERAPGAPERLPKSKLVIFALGQFGWSLASFGVSNLLNYFYMSPEKSDASRIFPSFIYEGRVFWIFSVLGLIAFASRLFDGVTNPLVASWSDRSKSRIGRRRFYMAISALPFALGARVAFPDEAGPGQNAGGGKAVCGQA